MNPISTKATAIEYLNRHQVPCQSNYTPLIIQLARQHYQAQLFNWHYPNSCCVEAHERAKLWWLIESLHGSIDV